MCFSRLQRSIASELVNILFYNDILDVHSSYRPEGSHPDILGDGYLMQTNPIYRSVKAVSLKIGCKYVEAYPDYLLLPFHELPNIVARKEIPYVPAARLMKNVEQNHPGVFSTDDMPMPGSYHLHEAAHVIAEHFLKNAKASSMQEKILKMILAESFANTVDALACTAVTDDIHYLFIRQNSYMHPQKKTIRAMNALAERMGFRFTFMLTYLTYVHANFLTSPLSKKAIQELAERYASGVKMDAKIKKNIEAVCEIGEKLDPQFRFTTTANYFKQHGFEGDIHDLLDFPFMKLFTSTPAFGDAVDLLAASLDSSAFLIS